MFFLKGFMFGMVLQLSIGPVCLAVWQRSVAQGFRESLKMVWGVTLVDSLYILAAFWGMDQLLRIKAIRETALIAGALVLIYFGLKYILAYVGSDLSTRREQTRAKKGEDVKPKDKAKDCRRGDSFALGVRLTLTNPLTVLFWSGVFSTLIASGSLGGFTSTLWYSLGCISSTIIFLGLVAAGGSWFSSFLNEGVRRFMDFSVGILLIIFGIRMAVRGILG